MSVTGSSTTCNKMSCIVDRDNSIISENYHYIVSVIILENLGDHQVEQQPVESSSYNYG